MTLETPTIVGNRKETRKKLAAVSAVLGMIIGIGVTAAVGGGVYYAFQEQADLFSSSSQIEIRNLSAVRNGDTLTITANIKNAGSTAITNLQINEINTGEEFVIFRDSVASGNNLKAKIGSCEVLIDGGGTGAGNDDCSTTAKGPDVERRSGFNNSGAGASVSLDGGASTAFQLKITQSGTTANISEAVQISDRLTFQLFYTSGQNEEFVSDIYNTRVRPG